MFLVLQVAMVFLVGTAMTMAWDMPSNFPGKLRLDEQSYKSEGFLTIDWF
jgi:hypothetical protein